MKKLTIFSAAIFAFLAFALLTEKISFARITSSAIDRDVWCVGVSGSEVCVDSSGNFIPTTNNAADLGTSSLKFKNLYLSGTAAAGPITGTTLGLSSTLSVGGQAVFNGTANHVSTISTRGVISADSLNLIFGVNAATGAFSSTLQVSGAVTASTNTTISGALQVNDNANISSSVVITSNLSVGGTSNISGVATSSATVVTGSFKLASKTIAQLDAYTPGGAGEYFNCSDCISGGIGGSIAVSSGAAKGAFVQASSVTVHIGIPF